MFDGHRFSPDDCAAASHDLITERNNNDNEYLYVFFPDQCHMHMQIESIEITVTENGRGLVDPRWSNIGQIYYESLLFSNFKCFDVYLQFFVF